MVLIEPSLQHQGCDFSFMIVAVLDLRNVLRFLHSCVSLVYFRSFYVMDLSISNLSLHLSSFVLTGVFVFVYTFYHLCDLKASFDVCFCSL